MTRIVLLGASPTAVNMARILTGRGMDVVIVERDKDKLSSIRDSLDCGFILGDGTRPALLREAGLGADDVLFCLTGDDQSNILASLVGRSLGVGRIVTKIEDPEYEHICRELGLLDVIVPHWNTAQTLADMATGRSPEDFASFFKADLRLFSFVVRDTEAVPVDQLDLPAHCRIVCVYRDDGAVLPDGDTQLQAGDEVVLVSGQRNIDHLRERFAPAVEAE